MDRKEFVIKMATLPIIGNTMKLSQLGRLAAGWESTKVMPLLFLGHGSPMNAIEENEFVRGFRKVAGEVPTPKAILCISAHWETRGTFVTAMKMPRTIHDFGGFPQKLFDVQYAAPGNPQLASEIKGLIKKAEVGLDEKWGLDHGAWSVIKQMYPNADIPVIQLSLDRNQTPQYHYDLAKELSSLRSKGVLIVGSGNMVHNLGKVAWDKLNDDEFGYDWALEAGSKMKEYIRSNNHENLINFGSQGRSFNLAIPTPEHYLPLLYVLGLKNDKEKVSIFNDKAVAGSITMTSVKITSS